MHAQQTWPILLACIPNQSRAASKSPAAKYTECISCLPLQAVQDVAAAGRCCVLDIDVQGARLVRASGLRAVFVFVAPPSSEELERRLRGRGTESEDQIAERLATAKQEIARRAAACWGRTVLVDHAHCFVGAMHVRGLGRLGSPDTCACPRARRSGRAASSINGTHIPQTLRSAS